MNPAHILNEHYVKEHLPCAQIPDMWATGPVAIFMINLDTSWM